MVTLKAGGGEEADDERGQVMYDEKLDLVTAQLE